MGISAILMVVMGSHYIRMSTLIKLYALNVCSFFLGGQKFEQMTMWGEETGF